MATAYLYVGQGAQKAGMGKDLYEHEEAFRRAFDSADNVDFDLHRVCFDDPDGVLMQTEYTQPCMTAVETGITAVLREAGLRPDYTAGLSLGEYSALEAAGVLTAKETIEMTAFRGKAMARASEGISCGMTAVLGLPETELQKCCQRAEGLGTVSVCNYNCPGQLVIGGMREAVDQAAVYAAEAGARRCIPLKVSGPFHTALMAPAGEELDEYFRHVTFRMPEAVVMYNYLGGENANGIPISDLLVKQVQNSVYMEQILRNLFLAGVTDFVEIGPGNTLTGFVRKTAKAMGISQYRTWNLDSCDALHQYLGQLPTT